MAGGEIHPDANDLQYTIYRKILHPEFFQIFARRKIEEEYYRGEVWIIATGHVVAVTTEKTALVEVVSQKGTGAPRRGVVKTVRIQERGLNRIQIAEPDGISYTSEFTWRKYPNQAYQERHDRAIVEAYDQRLLHTYNGDAEGGLRPFALIDYRASRGRLRVETTHAYPDDLTLVTTDSTFEI